MQPHVNPGKVPGRVSRCADMLQEFPLWKQHQRCTPRAIMTLVPSSLLHNGFRRQPPNALGLIAGKAQKSCGRLEPEHSGHVEQPQNNPRRLADLYLMSAPHRGHGLPPGARPEALGAASVDGLASGFGNLLADAFAAIRGLAATGGGGGSTTAPRQGVDRSPFAFSSMVSSSLLFSSLVCSSGAIGKLHDRSRWSTCSRTLPVPGTSSCSGTPPWTQASTSRSAC